MAVSKKQLHEEIRMRFLEIIRECLIERGEEVLLQKSNVLGVPTLTSTNEEETLLITFTVPTGSRDDGEPYDPYAVAEQYKEACEAKAQKKAEEAEKKARKIARDKAQREAKARAKAEAEAKKGEGV